MIFTVHEPRLPAGTMNAGTSASHHGWGVFAVVSFLALLAVAVAAAPAPADDAPRFVPQPPVKSLELGKEHCLLAPAVTITLPPKAGPVLPYAAETLARELRQRCGRKAAVQTLPNAAAEPDGTATLVVLAVDRSVVRTPAGGFHLTIRKRGDAVAIRITGVDAPGVLHGVFTLCDMLERERDGSLPCPVTIRDWPSMKVRAYTGCVRDVSPASLRTLDWLARWRLNAGYYEIYADRGQDSVPPEVKDIARETAKRGITLYGCVSNWRTNHYLGRPLCPSNPDDVALVERWFNELADAGCTALVFLFDDIPKPAITHPRTCPKCHEQFGDLAGSQAFWLERMAAIARRHGVERLLMCPTPYYRGWQSTAGGALDGVAYYARLGPVCERLGVDMYFCPYRSAAVADAVAAGLRRFVWWYNGAYPLERVGGKGRFASGMWGGFQELEFGWYNTQWDPVRGVIVKSDVNDALRTLPGRTRSAWLCAGGQVPWALWGIYTWSPERYDAKAARAATLRAVLGTEEAYNTWEGIVRKWMTISAKGGARWRSPAAERTLLDEMERDLAVAEKAVQHAAAPDQALVDPDTIQGIVKRMQASVDRLRVQLDQGRTGKVTVELGKPASRAVGDGKRFDQDMALSTFDTRYQLHYAIEGKPGAWHRCQWHFGSGLGMKAPSNRNWYDAGFVDVLRGNHSLDAARASFEKVGDHRIRGIWKTAEGTVSLTFHLRPDRGLAMQGKLVPASSAKALPVAVKLWCIPGAGWGSWKDMDNRLATPTRTVQHDRTVALDLEHEPWILLYDQTYDIPHPHAEGPAGLLLDPEHLAAVEVNLTNYVVDLTLRLKPGADAFSLVLWDFHGAKNADVLAAWRTNPPRWKASAD